MQHTESSSTGSAPPCCTPAAQRTEPVDETSNPESRGVAGSAAEMVLLPGGEFLMGSVDPDSYPADGEGPVRRVRLNPFWIDQTAVSNRQFAAFVEATGHRTEAERFGWSFVFAGLL